MVIAHQRSRALLNSLQTILVVAGVNLHRQIQMKNRLNSKEVERDIHHDQHQLCDYAGTADLESDLLEVLELHGDPVIHLGKCKCNLEEP